MVARVAIDLTPELARRIKQARESWGWTHEAVRDAGGPSSPTLTKIEAAEGSISPTTAAKIEKAFFWKPGTVAAIARGEDPDAAPSDGAADPAAGTGTFLVGGLRGSGKATATIGGVPLDDVTEGQHDPVRFRKMVKAAFGMLELATQANDYNAMVGLARSAYFMLGVVVPTDARNAAWQQTDADRIADVGSFVDRLNQEAVERVRNVLIHERGDTKPTRTEVFVRHAESTSGQPFWLVERHDEDGDVEPMVFNDRDEALEVARQAARRGKLFVPPDLADQLIAGEGSQDVDDDEG